MLRGIRRYMSKHQHQNWSFWKLVCAHRSGSRTGNAWRDLAKLGQEIADLISASGFPTVEVRYSKAKHYFPFVGVDNRVLGAMVARHFLDRGFRHFGCFAIDVESFVEERADSYIKTIAGAITFSVGGVPPTPS